MSQRERNKLEKLARIEDAGRQLFEQLGYETTTTRAIAERAGIGTGTLFNYFKEKRELLMHLYQQWVDEAIESAFETLPQSAASNEALADVLTHLFRHVFAVHEARPSLARVWVKELHFLEGERYASSATWTLTFIQRFAEHIRRTGALRPDVDPMQVSMHVFGLYYFSLVTWLGSNGIVSTAMRDQNFESWIDQLVNGVASTTTPRKART